MIIMIIISNCRNGSIRSSISGGALGLLCYCHIDVSPMIIVSNCRNGSVVVASAVALLDCCL